MSEAQLASLDGRVTALEKTVPDGLRRIEDLIQKEIHDLKTEQIRDIKNSVDRIETDTRAGLSRVENGLKKDIDRVSDDQRRLWEHVGKLELNDGQRTGGSKAIDRLWNFVSVAVGALITFAAMRLGTGGH